MAMAAPADPLSGDRDQLLVEAVTRRRPRAVLEDWRRQLATGPGSELFRTYLDLSLVCSPILYDQRDAAIAAVLQMAGDVPLLQYRAGICGETSLLKVVHQHDPDFDDVSLELARAALQRERPDSDEALTRFQLARAAFPRSATISASIGNLHQEREEWAEALEAYEATLALVPSHRDALLGKTVSLSHLSRHDDAIQSASRLLELGNWFTSDAHYWRAWNGYRLDLISDARADIDRAKALTLTPATLVLSGIIAWREKQLEFAETEFEEALKLDFGQCEAASYLGGVRAERQRWIEGLAAFEHAEQCFDLSIDARRKAVAELAAAGTSPQTMSRQMASHERAIADAEIRRTEAARNSAAIRRQVGVSAP
jgi:tetratricopeptide (TPR) repeat protein